MNLFSIPNPGVLSQGVPNMVWLGGVVLVIGAVLFLSMPHRLRPVRITFRVIAGVSFAAAILSIWVSATAVEAARTELTDYHGEVQIWAHDHYGILIDLSDVDDLLDGDSAEVIYDGKPVTVHLLTVDGELAISSPVPLGDK